MAKKIMCPTPGCERKATLYVRAWCKHRPWSDYRCTRHAARLLRLRGGLILRYQQNVTVRPITKLDLNNYGKKVKA